MIRQLATLCATTVLLVTALPATQSTAATQSAAAGPSACAKTLLPLPADAEAGSSKVIDADPSGRYVLGDAQHLGASQAVLWVDGVPRWLASQPDSWSTGYAVVKGGFVLGTTGNLASTDFWVYSVKTDSYRILKVPVGMDISVLTGMSARQDIVGLAWDDESKDHVHSFVWPADGQPRSLRTPKGMRAYSVQGISDEGRMIGSAGEPGTSEFSRYVWNSWDSRPIRLRGTDQESVSIGDIEGTWIGGQVGEGINSTGLIWNTRGALVAEIEDGVADVNKSGDAVTAGDEFIDHYPSVLVRRDGTRFTFPEGTMLTHSFDRNTPWTAGGYENTSGWQAAVLYKCGS